MALKDFIALADDKLHEAFNRKPHDATKARETMVKRLDKAHEQFHATEPARGRKLFKIQNGIVELSLPFEVSGKSTFHIPSERFADALKHLKTSVTKGELDDELRAAADKPSGDPAPAAAKVPRKQSTGGTGRGWTDERRAKFAATVAARNAGKGK